MCEVKVLLVSSVNSRFVRDDAELLRKHFNLKVTHPKLSFKPKRGYSPLQFLNLFRQVLWCNVVLCWFADVTAFFTCLLAKAAGKKTIIIVGGVDAAYQPEIDYGVFVKLISRIEAYLIYALADMVLPVDESLAQNLKRYLPSKLASKIHVLSTGYDPEKWKPHSKPKWQMVLTVATVNSETAKRKGIETFIETAKQFPFTPFIIAGKIDIDPSFILMAPENMRFTGYLTDTQLLRYYQQAKVYCQLSKFEGLPNALCEAMLCNCTPVGSDACGIPNAIGNTGYLTRYGDIQQTTHAVKQALAQASLPTPRQRIIAKFPISKREKGLVNAVAAVLHLGTELYAKC